MAPCFAPPRRRARRPCVTDCPWRRGRGRDARSEQHASAQRALRLVAGPFRRFIVSGQREITPDHPLFVRNRAPAPFFRAARETAASAGPRALTARCRTTETNPRRPAESTRRACGVSSRWACKTRELGLERVGGLAPRHPFRATNRVLEGAVVAGEGTELTLLVLAGQTTPSRAGGLFTGVVIPVRASASASGDRSEAPRRTRRKSGRRSRPA